ncbi:hypothetical protein GE09DRAFT_1209853 [Coniochaeta sp. 2T2.1]|nr:hypothetical protein GE09DRAFT_1209853 [Coniochaeta sp. 2T2.1]
MAAAMVNDPISHRQSNFDIHLQQTRSNYGSEMMNRTFLKRPLIQIISAIITVTAVFLFLEGAALGFWAFHSLSTVWAMTPLLAYPFLPSRGLFSIPREVFLIWPTGLGIVHLYSDIALHWLYGRTSLHLWQFWELPLMWFTLLAGFDRLLSQGRDEPNDEQNGEDFRISSENTEGFFYLTIAQVAAICVLNLPDEGSWPRYLLRLLCLFIDFTALIFAFVVWKTEIYLPTISRFTSRRVIWWT